MTDRIEIKRDPETGEVLSPCCGQPIKFAQTGLRGANCLACGKFVDAQAMLSQLAADVAELEPKAESWEAVHELTDPWSGIHTWGR